MAALYDPRYDYPNHSDQRFISSFRTPRARPAILSINSLEQAAPALQTGAYPPEMPINDFAEPPLTEAQKHARANIPAVAMYYNENGDLVPADTASINAYQGNILSDDTDKTGAYLNSLPTAREEAAAEAHRRQMLTPSAEMYGNAMQVGGNSNLPANDPDAVYMSLVKRYLDEGFGQKEAEAKANEQMEKSRLQLLKENAGALASSINTSVLAAGSDGSGSNRLTNFLSGLTYDALGYLTGTSAEAVKANGISLRVDGDEFFAFDGENTVSIDAKTAEAINAANNDVATQDPTAITGPFMGGYGQESLPPAPALTTPSTDTKAPQTDKGVLTAPSKPTQSTVRSTTGGYTGNARGSALPDMQIGLNERLMRMGAAGLAAGGQGSLAQLGAMFGASADVNQANRQAEMEAFGIEEERRQAHAARVAALAASKNKGADAATDFSSMASSLTEMEGLYAMLGQENLTGPLMGTVGKWAEGAGLFDFFRDKPKDAMKAYARFQLQGLKVDDTLLRVAQTKGAISDAEMKLFQSDTPSMTDSEGVWQRYLNERMVVLRKALAAQGYALNAPVKVGGATVTPLPNK